MQNCYQTAWSKRIEVSPKSNLEYRFPVSWCDDHGVAFAKKADSKWPCSQIVMTVKQDEGQKSVFLQTLLYTRARICQQQTHPWWIRYERNTDGGGLQLGVSPGMQSISDATRWNARSLRQLMMAPISMPQNIDITTIATFFSTCYRTLKALLHVLWTIFGDWWGCTNRGGRCFWGIRLTENILYSDLLNAIVLRVRHYQTGCTVQEGTQVKKTCAVWAREQTCMAVSLPHWKISS